MRKSFTLLVFLLLSQAAIAQKTPRLVKIETVTVNNSDVTRTFFGHVVARETVDLAFQVNGQIVEFPVIEGEPVAKDGLVAKLDLEPFELALDQARLQKAQADRTVLRLQKLKGSTVSQVSIDDAQTQSELAGIALRNAERALQNATLLSPFDALVATRNVPKFSTISAGTPVVRLHDMSEIRIEIDVPEILFQRAGHKADVKISANFPASPKSFPLEVREFNAETSQVGQTFKLTLGMAPPEGLTILPGSSVTVTATIDAGRGAATIEVPAAAIVAKNDGSTSVMLFSPDDTPTDKSGDGEASAQNDTANTGTVRATPVKIIPSNHGKVLVRKGLSAGDEIIATGAALLSDGQKVRRFTGFSN